MLQQKSPSSACYNTEWDGRGQRGSDFPEGGMDFFQFIGTSEKSKEKSWYCGELKMEFFSESKLKNKFLTQMKFQL